MPLVQFDPFPTVWSVERDLDRMLRWASTGERMWTPAVDLKRSGDTITATFDLPGMTEDDIRVEFAGGILTVSGERADEKEEKAGTWYHRERTFGTFSRSFALPADIDPGAITAHFTTGVLEVTMPSAPKPAPKRIPVLERAKKDGKERKAIAIH